MHKRSVDDRTNFEKEETVEDEGHRDTVYLPESFDLRITPLKGARVGQQTSATKFPATREVSSRIVGSMNRDERRELLWGRSCPEDVYRQTFLRLENQ